MLKIVLVLSILLIPTSRALGISEEQKSAIDSGAEYFNVEEDACQGSSAILNPILGNIPEGATVYMVGDSITNQSRTELTNEFTQAEFEVLEIDADSGRAIASDTIGSSPSGLQAVVSDAPAIQAADVVVVALGTNSGVEDLNVRIPELIAAIRTSNADVVIFWVNLFYTNDTNIDAHNSLIASNSSTSNYRIIDTTSANIELQSDGIHPTTAGNTTFAQTVVRGIRSGGSTDTNPPPSSSPGGSYDPLSLTYPAYPSDTEMAASITNYLREFFPTTPWFGIDSDIGTWLLRETRSRNINPFIIIAIGRQENGFGTVGGRHVREYYNYFGMIGTTPIDIEGSAYRGFSSPTVGMTYFLDTVQRNTQSADRGQYANVVNLYDYQSMHQSGIIAYPGEPLDPNDRNGPGGRPDGDRLNGWDNVMEVYISWDTARNDGPPTAVEYRGNTYNPGIYYANSIGLINRLTGLTLSDMPSRGGSGVIFNCVGGVGGGSGQVTGEGYAFPLAPQNRSIGGIGVGWSGLARPGGDPVHHDGTAAYDLFSPIDSADVFAIFDGEATRINTDYAGIPGCTTIQFRASDGYYYWYGHLKNPTITVNTPVRAGDKIAEIADRTAYTSRCWGGGPHLHIDRGCVIAGAPQTGGRDECRDPDFIAFLSSIYAELPAN